VFTQLFKKRQVLVFRVRLVNQRSLTSLVVPIVLS